MREIHRLHCLLTLQIYRTSWVPTTSDSTPDYFSWYQQHDYITQANVDSKNNCMDFACRIPRSTHDACVFHDARVFRCSTIFQRARQEKLRSNVLLSVVLKDRCRILSGSSWSSRHHCFIIIIILFIYLFIYFYQGLRTVPTCTNLVK